MSTKQNRTGIKDVAQHAGVSLSSVSRVLDNHADVSDAMRRRVLDAVAELGYTPDPLAQSMRRGKTMTTGFVAGDTSNPLISQIAVAAQLRLREAGYSLLVANSGNDANEDVANIRLLSNRKVDGMLLSVADETSDALRSEMDKLSFPVVLIDREVDGEDVSAVRSDHAIGIRAATRHLMELGHREIALINGDSRVRPSRERAAALREEMGEHAPIVLNGNFSDVHGYDAMMALGQRAERVTAVIAGSNQILVGVLRALRDLRLTIPEDISVVTCDVTPLAELHVPEIATIVRDPAALGREAVELLLNTMAGAPPEDRTLPTEFRRGASCAPVKKERR